MQIGLSKKLEPETSAAFSYPRDQPIRDEGVGAGQLERVVTELAREHEISTGVGQGWKLQPRFQADRASLVATYNSFVVALQGGHELAPAPDRFVKSFHLVDEQLQIIGQRLTWRFYHDLPVLARGSLAGYPRIYAIALSAGSNFNGNVGAETLECFLSAYQRINPLAIREIRAFDLTFRIVLVKKIKQLAERIAEVQAEFEKTERALSDLDHDELRSELDNAIADVISLSTLDWQKFFETVGVVDAILAEDPAGVYSSMDFASEDRYRHVVERLARRTETDELEVARRAINLASEASLEVRCERRHVGYYLIDDGLSELEKALNYHAGLTERFVRFARQHSTAFYLSAYALITAVIVAACVLYAVRGGASLSALIIVALLGLIPSSEIASLTLKVSLKYVFKPASLPKLDTSFGIPDEAKTIVVRPYIFSSPAQVEESLETIEADYLVNQDPNIFFALLGDWKAAAREEMPDDGALLADVLSGIRELNARYKEGIEDRFHLFHRRRVWSESEGDWEGWEKKRGKLREFNRLLCGACDTSYTTCTADPILLKQIRYVISLDSDTELPRDAARKLVGTILHPLNQPRLDAKMDHLRRGYGIVQPIVSSAPPKARASRIPQILSGYLGLNPYSNPAAVVSPNIYQDLFAEGNYVGKALYDVDTFEATLRERVPEYSVLSHDLLEGLYARSAVVTDIEVFDHSPTHYLVNARRNHRWTRGDWQLLPWLLSRVRDARGHYTRNALSMMGRWKILDNLRRSLIKPATLFWLLVTWAMLPAPASWTVLILIIFAGPVFFDSAAELLIQLRRNRQASFRANAWPLVRLSTLAALASIVYLAHQACLMIDAITRTLYRLFVSRKHLLEWITAAQVQEETPLSLPLFARYMWPASALALTAIALLAVTGRPALVLAAPLLLAWFVSPLFAYWISGKIQREFKSVEADVEMNARLNARSTFKFLETSIYSPASGQVMQHWRSPSNPRPANFGRLLAWLIAAYELGAITRIELLERLESTLSAMEDLPVSGDTYAETCGTSVPHHILLGERGNLAGFLRGLNSRITELSSQPLFDNRVRDGLSDTLLLLKSEFLGVRAMTPRGQADDILYNLSEEIENCLVIIPTEGEAAGAQKTAEWGRFLRTMGQRAAVIEFIVGSFSEKCPAISVEDLRWWISDFVRQTQELQRELYSVAPWMFVRTAHLEPIIRRYCASALESWNHIVEGLNCLPKVSLQPENLEELLAQFARLSDELQQVMPSNAVEYEIAFKRCAELKSAIENSARAARDAKLRYARLANRCEATANADFRPVFDKEYKLLRNHFQISMVG